MSRLLALYPAAWRSRYGDEFRALLADRPPATIGDRIDILRGALDAHLDPQLRGPERTPDRYALAPLAGFALLVAAVLLASIGPIHSDEYGTYREGSAALPLFALALLLLSIGLHRVVVRLPHGADGPRRAGWTAMVAGPAWGLVPWVAPLGLVFLVAVLLLAVGARRAGLWPAWSELLLVAMLALPAGLFAAVPFLPWYALRVSGLDLLVVLGPISGMWLVVGGLLVRGFSRTARL